MCQTSHRLGPTRKHFHERGTERCTGSDHHFHISSSGPRPYTACLWRPRQTIYHLTHPSIFVRRRAGLSLARAAFSKLNPLLRLSHTGCRSDETRSQVASRFQHNENEGSRNQVHGNMRQADAKQVCLSSRRYAHSIQAEGNFWLPRIVSQLLDARVLHLSPLVRLDLWNLLWEGFIRHDLHRLKLLRRLLGWILFSCDGHELPRSDKTRSGCGCSPTMDQNPPAVNPLVQNS